MAAVSAENPTPAFAPGSNLPPPPPPPDWRMLLRMTRPAFLLLTAAACVLGLAFAWSCGCGFDGWKAAATLLLALMAHAGANVLNDYWDARNGADAANTQGLHPFTGGSRLIQGGLVSEQETGRWALALLLLVVIGGLALVLFSGLGLLWIGLAGLLLAWAYSAPPLALMQRGLGELATALAWWLVVLGADYVQRRQFLLIPAATAISFALLVMNLLLVNGFADAPSDAQVGKNTLVVRLGPQWAAGFYGLVALLAHGWLVWMVGWQIAPAKAWWGLASLPLSLGAAGWLLRHARQPARLRPAIVLSIAACLLHALALSAGLVATRWE